MKQLFTTLFTLLTFCFASYAQTGSELDNENGTSMAPIINTLAADVKDLEKEGLEIVHIEYDLMFENGTKDIYRNLSTDYNYGFLVFSDYRIKQIGIDLYKESGSGWEFIKSGELTDNSMILLSPNPESGRYKIVLRTLQMNEGYTAGHYGLYIVHN